MDKKQLRLEESVIATCIRNREAFDSTVGLSGLHFEDSTLRKIWESMEALSLVSGDGWDGFSIADQSAGALDIDTLTGLATNYSVGLGRISENVDRLKESFVTRTLRSGLKEVENCSDEDLRDEAERVLTSIVAGTADAAEPLSMVEQGDQWITELERERLLDGSHITRTGLSDLDSRVVIKPGELVVLAGRPGAGKTVLALQLAYNAAISGKKGLVISLEMMLGQLMGRMASMVSESLTTDKLREPQFLTADDMDEIHRVKEQVSSLGLRTDYQAVQSVGSITSKARKLSRMGELDFLVVDYLQLIAEDKSQQKRGNRQEAVSDMSRSLKLLAKELAIPVILLAQLNRSATNLNVRPTMANLRESGAIEQDADWVLILYQDEDIEKPEEKGSIVEVLVRKARNGRLGTELLGSEFEHSRFRNVPKYESTDYWNAVNSKASSTAKSGKPVYVPPSFGG